MAAKTEKYFRSLGALRKTIRCQISEAYIGNDEKSVGSRSNLFADQKIRKNAHTRQDLATRVERQPQTGAWLSDHRSSDCTASSAPACLTVQLGLRPGSFRSEELGLNANFVLYLDQEILLRPKKVCPKEEAEQEEASFLQRQSWWGLWGQDPRPLLPGNTCHYD